MRLVDVPAGSPDFLVHPTEDPAWSAQAWMDARNCSLADVEFDPPLTLAEEVDAVVELDGKRVRHRASTWITRCARYWGQQAGYPEGFRPAWFLNVCQMEQSLLSVKRPERLDHRVKFKITSETVDPGKDAYLYQSRGGPVQCVRVEGEKRMYFAAGAGCPDAGAIAGWDVPQYLGLAAQAYWVYRMAARDVQEWQGGKRDVHLYTTDEERAERERNGVTGWRLDVGEKVVAGSPRAYLLLKYTPAGPRPDGTPLRAGWGNVLVDRPVQYAERGFPV